MPPCGRAGWTDCDGFPTPNVLARLVDLFLSCTPDQVGLAARDTPEYSEVEMAATKGPGGDISGQSFKFTAVGLKSAKHV